MSVLRRAYVEVSPDTKGFDAELTKKLQAADPGGKAGKLIGKQLGGQLNRALAKLDLPAIDVKADPKTAVAAIDAVEEKLRRMSADSATVEVKVQTERAISQLGRFRKQLGEVGDDGGDEAAVGFAARFGARLGPLMASASAAPPVVAGAGLLGAALAPSLMAGLGAAVAGGVGAGAMFAGIKLVAKDPQVAEAGQAVGQRFSQGVALEAEAFKKPVLGALGEIDDFASRTTPKIGQIFRNAAPQVEGLTKNLTAAGDAIANSLVSASARSAGPLRALGDGVQRIGVEFSHLIDTVSARAPEGTSAIEDLTGALTRAVQVTTVIADNGARVKGWADNVDGAIDKGRAWLEDQRTLAKVLSFGTKPALDLTADGYKQGTQAAELYRQGVIGAKGAVNDYDAWLRKMSGAMNAVITATQAADPPQRALIGTLTNADRAALGERNSLKALSAQLLAQANPAFALIEAQRGLRQAQNDAAKATRDHGRNSDAAREATRRLALAALDLQGKAGALGATFNGKLSPQMLATFRAAGLTEGQIRDVAREFGAAKKAGDGYAKKYQANVNITGQVRVDTELGRLLAVQAALRSGNPLTAGSVNKAVRGVLGPQLNRATGGPISGSSPSKTADDIPVMATAGEHMWTVDEVRAAGGHQAMARMRKAALAGELRGYAAGGQIWPFPVTAAKTRIPSMAEVTNAVTPAFTGGAATLPWIRRVVESHFPGLGLISGFRPGAHTLSGNLSYHALRRAADYPASRALAEFWNRFYKAQTKEFISPWNSLNILNGRRHAYTGAIYRQHSGANAHDHIAMAGGGIITEPVIGVGRSGRTYSFGERGPETVTPGMPGEVVINLNNCTIASKQGAQDLMAGAWDALIKERRIRKPKDW